MMHARTGTLQVSPGRVDDMVRQLEADQLPRYRDMKDRKGPISYVGPVLAGDRLIVAGSNGALINVNPVDGAFQSQVDLKEGVSFQPVVANNTMYLLTDSGRLIAYR